MRNIKVIGTLVRINEKYRTLSLCFFSTLLCLCFVFLNQNEKFDWPLGSTSQTRDYIAVILPDGSDFRNRCRTQWKDECVQVIQSSPSWPDELTIESRIILERKVLFYLKKHEIFSFDIEIRTLELNKTT